LEQYFEIGRQATLALRFPSPQHADLTSANPEMEYENRFITILTGNGTKVGKRILYHKLLDSE
jgi:hypothetical protein